MNLRKALLPAAAAMLAFLPAANVRADDDDDDFYFYQVSGLDGGIDIREMTSDQARDLRKQQRDAYREAGQKWLELKKNWLAAVGANPFPVPKPRPPKMNRLGEVDEHRARRIKDLERYQHRLDHWNVCIIKDMQGERKVDVIRRDKMYGRKQTLMKDYVNAVIEWAARRKESPDKEKKGDPPGVPAIATVKSSLRSAEKADELAGKLAEQLEKLRQKKETKRNR